MPSFHKVCPLFQKHVCNQFWASLLCNVCVMAACAAFTWIEPLTMWLVSDESEIKLTRTHVSWLSATSEIGVLASAIPMGILADRWGRKTMCLLTGPIGLASWIIILYTRNIIALYVSRLLQGMILTISVSCAPTYIAEIASADVRGAFGGHTVVFIYIGYLYSYTTSYHCSYQVYLYVQAILPVVSFITFIFMPESPYFYFMVKKYEKAEKALKWLRPGADITREFNEIKESVEKDMKRKGSRWKDLVATRFDRRVLLVVQLVNVAAYMTGVQSLSMFATETFAHVPLLWFSAKELTIVMGVILTISAFVASFVADTVGRRKLLIISASGITVSNLFIGTYLYLAEKTDYEIREFAWAMYIGLVGLCAFTNIGVGELVHTIQAEYFPSHTRSLGGGITSTVASTVIFITVLSYQPMSGWVGFYMNFALYAVISLITLVLMCIYVDESAGKTMAELNVAIQTKVYKKGDKPVAKPPPPPVQSTEREVVH